MNSELRARLESLADPGYRAFSARLLPVGTPLLGVRLPALRRIARELSRGDWRAYLDGAADGSFEEILLQGMVIGYAEMDMGERQHRTAAFVPKISNWSVCDSFCAGLKGAATEKEAAWRLVEECLADRRPYYRRFGLVMEMDYFLDGGHMERVLESAVSVGEEDYYVKMAAGWCLAECYAADPEKTDRILRSGRLHPDVLRLAQKKIRESRKIGETWQENARKIGAALEKQV